MDEAKSRMPAKMNRTATSASIKSPITPIGEKSIMVEKGMRAIRESASTKKAAIFKALIVTAA